ncbi:MAG: YlmC/YmxH family sporulation protein [Eubacteriaceae bacterium]|nr:YlmC/YmxH family sporulation protein [Eubacteriaceae bacterium]
MLLGNLRNKVIINVLTGEKIGYLRNCDLQINDSDGRIEAILMPKNKLVGLFTQQEDYIKISWADIVKIGPDSILVNAVSAEGE